MKKVRYALGAVGAATPVLGLMVPATAATAASASHKLAKAASLAHRNSSQSASASAGCRGNTSIRATATNFHYSLWIDSLTGCVGGVSAYESGSGLPSVQLRTRAYSISAEGGHLRWFSNYIGGQTHKFTPPYVTFYQGIHQIRPHHEEICEAVVQTDNHAVVYRGPKCVSW